MTTPNRKERSDKKVRIFPYLTQETYRKLNRLAKACDISPHELAAEMVEALVANPSFINWIQDKHRVDASDPLRVVPLVHNGKVSY
jgi:hypothetical protein